MVAIVNAAHVFKEYPDESMPVPGRTTETVTDKIDLDNVPLNGGVLIRTLVLSMDPYLRGKMHRTHPYESFKVGETLTNYGVGLVLRSEHSALPVGAHVYGILPFNEYFVQTDLDSTSLRVLPENTGLPWSAWVGSAGMPGQTAYFSWKEYSHAKKGETVFVSGGAGAVGSFVVQLAKQDGLKVIASAGTDQKVKFLKDIGVDVAFNYKTTSTVEVLEKEGPIDIYYDNVGGPTLDAALNAANLNARFIICGAISGYNKNEYGIKNLFEVAFKSITLSGFVVGRLAHKYEDEFYTSVPALIHAGKVRYQEHRYNGLDSTCHALVDVLTGKNEGKAVIIVADERNAA